MLKRILDRLWPRAPRWAIVEVFGHRKHVGKVEDVSWLGHDFLRVEALDDEGKVTVYRYASGAIFSMADVSEHEARLSLIPKGWVDPCSMPEPAIVLPTHCSVCGNEMSMHTGAPPDSIPF